ncbi:MAG: metal ABC transporter ATP-binding protein [Patescibacteria group bacterium]
MSTPLEAKNRSDETEKPAHGTRLTAGVSARGSDGQLLTGSTLLEVKNLSVFLGGVEVLHDVTFIVEEGSMTAVIGPNGSGKTTLFRALMGMAPYAGEIVWHKKVRFGYVPQRLDFDRLFPLTVRELFLLRRRSGDFWLGGRSAAEAVRNALSHVHAAHLIPRRIGTLSGGELQRVLIAYAIFERPDVLFFDEPTTGIDVAGEATAYSLIKHLAKELRLTVLLISHDLNVVFQYVDQVICLNRAMLCYGAPQKVLTPTQLQELYGAETVFYHHRHAAEPAGEEAHAHEKHEHETRNT